MTTDAEIIANRDSRTIGEDLFNLAKYEISQLPESHRRRAWALLTYRIAEHTGTIAESEPKQSRPTKLAMTREQAAMFERSSLPFTTKQGNTPIGQIELGYLSWLHEKHQKDHVWFERLGAYLNSSRVQAEVSDDNEPEIDDAE